MLPNEERKSSLLVAKSLERHTPPIYALTSESDPEIIANIWAAGFKNIFSFPNQAMIRELL